MTCSSLGQTVAVSEIVSTYVRFVTTSECVSPLNVLCPLMCQAPPNVSGPLVCQDPQCGHPLVILGFMFCNEPVSRNHCHAH